MIDIHCCNDENYALSGSVLTDQQREMISKSLDENGISYDIIQIVISCAGDGKTKILKSWSRSSWKFEYVSGYEDISVVSIAGGEIRTVFGCGWKGIFKLTLGLN